VTEHHPSEFGPNEWLVDELYQQYLDDRESVDPAWWDFFADYQPSELSQVRQPTDGPGNGRSEASGDSGGPTAAVTAPPDSSPAPVPAPSRPVVITPPPSAAQAIPPAPPRHGAAEGPKAAPTARPLAPAPREPLQAPPPAVGHVADSDDDVVVRLKGPAARVVTNMNSSLELPTATSVRAVPAKLLIDNRVVINNHLTRARGGKVSFTHIIGFALVEALAQMPEMNAHYTEEDGKPAVVHPAHVNLGIAIDLLKDDGTRQLLVPSVRNCEAMDFATFWGSYEDVIRRARAGRLTADDFAGTTLTLTNPGTIGTMHSVPRLMKGQGCIIGVGAMEYPAEYQGASEETLARLAVSKILTLTSTYDHRVIQGAQSGDFLRIVHGKLLGDDGFYERIFHALRIPYEPIRWVRDISVSHDDEINKTARVQELIHAYRVRGHLMADTDPLEYKQRRHPDLDVTTHGLTLWDLDREFPTGGFGGKPVMKLRHILGVLRDSYCRTVGIEYMHIQDPEQRRWIQERVERPYAKPLPGRAAADPADAERCGGLRDVPADEVRRAEALQPRGRGERHPADGRAAVRLRAGGAGRGVHRDAAPRPAERPGQPRRQELRADLPRVRGHRGPEERPGLRGREVPPRHRGPVHRDHQGADQGLPGRQPLPPGGGQPGARGRRPGQAGPPQPRQRVLLRAAGAHARRRGVRRPGRGRRDAQPLPAARVPHGRHRARRDQQPGRLHHRPGRLALVVLLHGRRQDDPGADLPHERRRPGGVRPGGPARLRVPDGVRQGRRDRPRLLPPARAQRGRRPVDDPAADVQPDRGQAQRPQAVHRGADRPR
jgi:pyruvate/2-oxoglutarate dehydrogenase complex dihydrolipoamide acyltransferase (E2) component